MGCGRSAGCGGSRAADSGRSAGCGCGGSLSAGCGAGCVAAGVVGAEVLEEAWPKVALLEAGVEVCAGLDEVAGDGAE